MKVENVERQIDLKNRNPCGHVSESYHVPEVPRMTSFTGPSGPVPSLETERWLFGSFWVVKYEGPLENGNNFGTCDVIFMGSYEEEPSVFDLFKARKKGTWRLTGTMTIAPPNPPIFAPAQLTIPKGGQGDVDVTVQPACKYDVTFSIAEEIPNSLQVLPSMLTTDKATGVGRISVRDLRNEARGPITVTATISPQGSCQGAPDVTASFTVTVTD